MDKKTFEKFRKIVYEKSGISLGERKEALVAARVGKRMRVLEIDDYATYLRRVMNDETGAEVVHLLDAISTNVTSFFREENHFEFLEDVILHWLAKGQNRFRLWSAACSTGEEPFTLAMTLMECFNGHKIDLKILATDISTRALDKCREATYDKEKLKKIPPLLRDRYFDAHKNEEGITYGLKAAIKNTVVFKRLNLSRPPFPMHGPFDVIFCRNVMIYFDNYVRGNLLADMYRLLRPGGYLMVGHAESLTGMVSDFRTVRPSIYIKQ